MNRKPMVEVRGVYKNYQVGDIEIPVLRNISFDVSPGEFVAIVGPSGNGKTTLMNMITGIDHPTQGKVFVNGELLNQMGEDDLATWRGANLGIVFQFFQLLFCNFRRRIHH